MRSIKLIGAMFVVLAFSAVAVATASAAETLWKWLPGSVGETFTGKSGKATLQAGIAITCAKSTILLTGSELIKEGSTSEKDATLGIATVHFEKCTAAGLPVNSVGDAAETILTKVAIHNCMVTKADFGLIFKVEPAEGVKLEVPSTKLTVVVKDAFIGLIEGKEGEKLLTFKLNIKQKEGKQEIKECEGAGVAQTLLAKIDAGVFAPAGEEVKEGTLTFDGTKDTKGEELMEK